MGKKISKTIPRSNSQDTLSLQFPTGNANKLTPSFVFESIHRDFCLSGTEDEFKSIFAEKLITIGRTTWQEIIMSSRLKKGTEIIDRKDIKQELPYTVPDDANILAFHVKDKFRIIGYRNRRELHVIFIDCQGNCYTH